ncbi:hypothetical protein [Crassaminicella indica]|uniref:adenosine deaminase n=1 Tax=Crassaminicella indica TaxID=2855394 RepID=A0ABX8RCH4_9CLOT|nr:hypothetical protein [Crassaminicella indica]QXM05425.1 hypothetical protein KVH43_08500 [Crassaminicella indica]
MFREKMDLRVKILTLPFTEFTFYKEDYFEKLAKKTNTNEYNKYFQEEFLNKIYPILNRNQKINNLDEIKLLVQKYYPQEKLNTSSYTKNGFLEFYLNYLTELSKIFLTHRNGNIALKYWEGSSEKDLLGPYKGLHKVVFWNSLNRMFTTDILVILYLLENGMEEEYYLKGYHSNVMVEDLQLQNILSKGVAETHMHMNAGIDFAVTWQELMSVSRKSIKKNREKIINEDKVIGKDIQLNIYINAMAITRILLAKYLSDRDNLFQAKSQNLICYYEKMNFKDGLSVLDFLKKIYKGENLKNDIIDYELYFEDLKAKFNLTETVDDKSKDWEYDFAKKDIIHKILCTYGEYSIVENIFLFRSLKYIRKHKEDEYFAKIFWQYIRIKNEVFQLKVQTNYIRGLDNFIDYYNRSVESDYKKKELMGLIMSTQFKNTSLQKLEGRITVGSATSVEGIKKSLKEKIIAVLEAYQEISEKLSEQKRKIPDIGLIIHFIKKKDKKMMEKCWVNYKEKEESAQLYFREMQEEYFRQIQAINELREDIEGLSDYIVGIDAAAIENDTEPWVFAPIYEFARNSDTHKLVYSKGYHKRIKNLGFTFHAGEDFRHILTGIRRIDEVIKHFKFHAGDRIGHGIAIGIDPKKWVLDNRITILPRIEHIENLLWIWGLCKDGNFARKIDAHYLEREILMRAEAIYQNMNGITVYNLWKAYQNKFKIFRISQKYGNAIKNRDINNHTVICNNELFCFYIQSEYAMLWDSDKLTHAQHCKCYLKKMLEPIEIEVKKEDIDMIIEVQKFILSQVSKAGIIIETNPTSNTAIGNIENLFEHYVHHLNQNGLDDVHQIENGIIVSINSDDPSVFNTNVSNEFAYTYYALIEKGYAKEDVLKWINKVRKNGMASSFIETRKLTYEQKKEEVEDIIEKLNKYI